MVVPLWRCPILKPLSAKLPPKSETAPHPGWQDGTILGPGKELSEWCCKNIFYRKIKSAKKNRVFDIKWLVLDNSKAKREFKWKIKYKKNKIFKDILNENN